MKSEFYQCRQNGVKFQQGRHPDSYDQLGTELARFAWLRSFPQGGHPDSYDQLGTELARFAWLRSFPQGYKFL